MSTVKNDRPFNPRRHNGGRPEVWGGIECTINRIDDLQYDQLQVGGHYSRQTDFGALAELGITSLRFPILWEKHQPDLASPIDWSWTARQLIALRRQEITPIAGLLHHGSGPRFTDLASPDFASDFANYAGQVAARFPWLEWYTPVNEPLTTARFSGLYGIWYPHRSNPLSFIRMLLNQLRGTVGAMKAIRKINPAARFIQTEDLAKVHSTPILGYQADFENHRRWLTFDLLCGRLDRSHPLWDYLSFIGIQEKELTFFTDNPCSPDILGLNYYITSERFLDDNLQHHHVSTHGGNGRHTYADTEAVRVMPPAGLFPLLKETWDRYRLPVAVTETHLHCTREEQVRWLKEVWDCACRASEDGVDVRAVTSWALCGTFDWDSLLTRFDGHYEQGACELIGDDCRMTAVGHALRSLALTGDCHHPLLSTPGWWHRGHGARTDTQGYLLILCDDDPMQIAGSPLETITGDCEVRGLPFVLASQFPAFTDDDQLPWAVLAISEDAAQRESCRAMQTAYASIAAMDGQLSYNDLLDSLIDESFALRSPAAIHDLIPTPCL